MSYPTQRFVPHEMAFDFVVVDGVPGTPIDIPFTDRSRSDPPVRDNNSPQFTIHISPRMDFVTQSSEYAFKGWHVTTTANSTQVEPSVTDVHMIVHHEFKKAATSVFKRKATSNLVAAYTKAYKTKKRLTSASDAEVEWCELEEEKARTKLGKSLFSSLKTELFMPAKRKTTLSRLVVGSGGSGTIPTTTYRFRFVADKDVKGADGASATVGATGLQDRSPSL